MERTSLQRCRVTMVIKLLAFCSVAGLMTADRTTEDKLYFAIRGYDRENIFRLILITILCVLAISISAPSLFGFFLFMYSLHFIDVIFVYCLRRGVQRQEVHLIRRFCSFSVYKTIVFNASGIVFLGAIVCMFFGQHGFDVVLESVLGTHTHVIGCIVIAFFAFFMVLFNVEEYGTRRLCHVFCNEINMKPGKEMILVYV